MHYKGFTAKITYDDSIEMWHAEALGTLDVIVCQAATTAELLQAYIDSVDDYLEFCKTLPRAENRRKQEE